VLGGLGWVGNVPNPGYPVNLMKVLPYVCDLGVSLVLKVKKRVPLVHQLSVSLLLLFNLYRPGMPLAPLILSIHCS